jgi:signal transduction histidine kinase
VTIIGATSLFVDGGAWGQFIIYLSGLIFSIGTFFAIFRHGLFDVRQAISRSFAYVLSIGTLALVYFALAYVVSVVFFKNNTTSGVSISPINIGLSLVLAFAFQPIKRFFDKVTNFLFYRDVYNVEEFFARLTKRLSIITNLDVLLRYSSSEISNTLKASFGAFYIHQIGKEPVYISTSEKVKKLPQEDVQILDTHVLDNHQEIVITEELTDKSTRGLKRMLDSHHIALSLPITKDSIITGYLFLGEHLSSQYSIRDIRALLTIADELMIAIQNALSVQEIRELNDSLQHRVDVATKELRASNAMLRRLDKSKDDFISMASHQLRTPLTSIKGYISMVREGDVGKITKTQDELLGEAFTSSERMVHLINDFLNVSRLQTGKFLIDKHPTDLAKVIEQELDSLTTNAKSRKLAFDYKAPKNFPVLNLDEDKMRQVIMNFSDNAIYYSKEGTKIKVHLAVQGKNAIFTVTDTGIGVPRSEQSQLFNKFYRASNARQQRPDGTGVGLYLAKKVIDAHEGKVIFESIEGKGSTFGFKLPIDGPIDELRA